MIEYSNKKCKCQKTKHRGMTCQDEKPLEDQSMCRRISSVKTKCSKDWSKKTGYHIKNHNGQNKHLSEHLIKNGKRTNLNMIEYSNVKSKCQKTEHRGTTCQDKKPLEEQSMYCRISSVKTKRLKDWSRKTGYHIENHNGKRKHLKTAEYANDKSKRQKTEHRGMPCQDDKSLEEQSMYCRISSVKAKCSKEGSKKTGYLTRNCKGKRKYSKIAEYSNEKYNVRGPNVAA